MSTNTKKILGLDLGSNSIGWALIQQNFEEKYGKILGLGSRIIPMSQDVLGKFDSGVTISQTAERTRLRGVRRLRERHLLRRERLHRVLNVMGFLPTHYANKIDFEQRLGKFLPETETKFAYDDNGEFIFKKSFNDMLEEFRVYQPQLLNRKNKNGELAKIPYDWTIYYLRKKALTHKIENEELAWLLLHFNQKRGYYQLRGEDSEEKTNKKEEFWTLKIVEVKADEPQKGKTEIWYNLFLENGWVYRRASKSPLFDWKDKVRDFIVTTDMNEDGSIKKDKEGTEKRSFRSPKDDDWQLLKKKTESEIDKSNKTVGEFIYETLLHKPSQKIKGTLVRTIERKYYKEELIKILRKQVELNSVLNDKKNIEQCAEELYPHNLHHRSSLIKADFIHLFVEDILYYQRPLRSQKNSISNCPLEKRIFIHEGIKKEEPLKCIPKSHPLFQEFRLWQWISNLRIYNKNSDIDETSKYLFTTEQRTALFDFLNTRKEVDQNAVLKRFRLSSKNHRWNYVEDKKYPCNETYAMIASRLEKVIDISGNFLTKQKESELWHIIYSVTDKIDYEKALKSFATKNNINVESFYEAFRKFPPFPSSYGSYSAKAIKKILTLLRIGKYWEGSAIDDKTTNRINKIIDGEYDENIRDRVREKTINLSEMNDFQGLPEWLAKYIIYDRHAERSDTGKWKTISDMEQYLELFRQHSLKNPIVEQVLTETLRVVRDIWKYYGKGTENFFDEIHIELSREMKNPKDKRKEMSDRNTINENTNLRIKALLSEMLNDSAVENVRPYSPMQQDILKVYEEGVLNADVEIPDDILKISKLSQPTSSELQRYKLWLEQKYRSPYTGEIIPLNKLFTPAYEIEHIIPQKRYFDNNFSNKVICEAAVNKLKDNCTALEFIQKQGGRIEPVGMGKTVKIFEEEEYIKFVQQNYQKNYTKRNKLLALDIPEKMIERQLNDTRYISKYVMHVLSNLVRQETNDDGDNSKNVLATNGQITSKLKQDWGMDAVWNELILHRFERLNSITNSTNFTAYNDKYQKYLPIVPLELQKGFQKKRIDHRHHAMDALIIASATRNHINYLNNKNAINKKKSPEEKQKERYDLKVLLCNKKYNEGSNDDYNWVFKHPWESFVTDAKEQLENVIVTFKQDLRIINKTTNYYEVIIGGAKEKIKQDKGQNWAIRKPLHKDTVSGQISLKKIKIATLSYAVENPDSVVDKSFRKAIVSLLKEESDKKKVIKLLKEKFEGNDISKVSVYYWDNDNVSSRTNLDTSFTEARIRSTIADTGIQKILLKHLENNGNNAEVAFSPEGIENMNENILALNNGKFHQPIFKVRTYETKGNKFEVGQSGSKKAKFVEAAKGTNLFFGIYSTEAGRSYETVPLNIVVERQKQGLSPVPEVDNSGNKLLMFLSPNDLVYIPDEEDINIYKSDFSFNKEKSGRIYRFVSCTGGEGHFVHNNYAVGIINNEQGTNNKSERMLDYNQLPALRDEKGKPKMIKTVCWKITVDRIGNLKSLSK